MNDRRGMNTYGWVRLSEARRSCSASVPTAPAPLCASSEAVRLRAPPVKFGLVHWTRPVSPAPSDT